MMKLSLALLGPILAIPRITDAQELITYSISWSEVNAGSIQPVPVPNGVIDPGEGVRIAIRVAISPGIGATAAFTPPPPPGWGTIAGFGSMFVDLLGTNLNGGTWSNMTHPGGWIWVSGAGGTALPNGNVINCQAGQFVIPGSSANSSNPVDNLWRGTWTPGDYSNRNASIAPVAAAASAGSHSSILIQYGVDGSGSPLYVGKFVPGVFNGTGNIPIAPAPAGFVVIGAAAALARRRAAR